MKRLVAILLLALPLTAAADAPTKIEKAVQFDYGRIKIPDPFRKELLAFAKQWKQHPVSIMIEGNAYIAEDEEASIALGQRRADNVRDYLVLHGVDAKRITAIGYSRATLADGAGRYVDLVLQ